ncbi:MAG: ABC-2 type transport system ATP-binding protein [Chlamydiales bacterium]|jgi:ABC-2 type transport system ATP-binding protein
MIIELTDVAKYYGKFQALAGLTVSVKPGAIGLLGPNGAGKSTLIKGLLGLVKLSSGSAKVLGLDARTQSPAIREQVGYMPEDDCSIAGLAGVQSVALAGELAGLPALTALRRAHEILDYVALGEERYREVQTYSTGMRQKVKLAQSLVHAPKLLFLDEPTNGLDPAGRVRMLRLIRSLVEKRGMSVVLSTHILTDVETCCDAALILGRGKLLVYDTIPELRRSVHPSCRVRVAGDIAPLSANLQARGYRIESAGRDAALVFGADDLGAAVFAASRETGITVREMTPSRNSLEDIYLDAVRATEAGPTMETVEAKA